MTNKYIEYAENFKHLKIPLIELKRNVPYEYFMRCNDKIIVFKEDLENLLTKYKNKVISKSDLLDWVNTVWFSELFTYDEKYCDMIASIMNELEEADEREEVLNDYNINKYLRSLKNNSELD